MSKVSKNFEEIKAEINETFCERLKALFNKKKNANGKKFTKELLAREAGISINTIRNLFSGDTYPSIEHIYILAEYFNVPTSYLYDSKFKHEDIQPKTTGNSINVAEKLQDLYRIANELSLEIDVDVKTGKSIFLSSNKSITEFFAMNPDDNNIEEFSLSFCRMKDLKVWGNHIVDSERFEVLKSGKEYIEQDKYVTYGDLYGKIGDFVPRTKEEIEERRIRWENADEDERDELLLELENEKYGIT